MTDDELIGALRFKGIDRASYKVVALLPLVRVAWADGQVQTAERALIEEVARSRGLVEADGARILRGWLENAPTDEYVRRGNACLKALAERSGGHFGGHLDVASLDQVVSLCEQVAAAAGGLFGILWSVDDRERAAIEEIARALRG